MSENINHRQIHWFPGHMMKTLRVMEASIRQVDVVLELLDASIPHSSMNPEIERIAAAKPRLYLLNKADLADPNITAAWVRYFKNLGCGCVAITSKNRSGIAAIKKAIDTEMDELLSRRADRGMLGAKIRIMVTGIPNVGKSTFINAFTGSNRVQAADSPGVTRGKQWVNAGEYELLDMPGVLWKKFESDDVASNLAFIGSIKDDILDVEEIAMRLLAQLQNTCPDRLEERYRLSKDDLALDAYDLLECIGRKRGMMMSGGVVNTERAAQMLVDEFRASKLGRMSLEKPTRPEKAEDAQDE